MYYVRYVHDNNSKRPENRPTSHLHAFHFHLRPPLLLLLLLLLLPPLFQPRLDIQVPLPVNLVEGLVCRRKERVDAWPKRARLCALRARTFPCLYVSCAPLSRCGVGGRQAAPSRWASSLRHTHPPTHTTHTTPRHAIHATHGTRAPSLVPLRRALRCLAVGARVAPHSPHSTLFPALPFLPTPPPACVSPHAPTHPPPHHLTAHPPTARQCVRAVMWGWWRVAGVMTGREEEEQEELTHPPTHPPTHPMDGPVLPQATHTERKPCLLAGLPIPSTHPIHPPTNTLLGSMRMRPALRTPTTQPQEIRKEKGCPNP